MLQDRTAAVLQRPRFKSKRLRAIENVEAALRENVGIREVSGGRTPATDSSFFSPHPSVKPLPVVTVDARLALARCDGPRRDRGALYATSRARGYERTGW